MEDLDVNFEFNATSSIIDVSVLANSVHDDLVDLFMEDPESGTIAFNAHLDVAAAALGYGGTNSSAGTAAQGAVNVLQPDMEPDVVP